MRLKYVGISPADNGWTVPLPEGWTAADIDVEDETLAAEMIASGNYQADSGAAPAPAQDAPATTEQE